MVLKYSDDSEDLKEFEESSDEDEMETLTDLEEEEIRYFCLVGQEATGSNNDRENLFSGWWICHVLGMI